MLRVVHITTAGLSLLSLLPQLTCRGPVCPHPLGAARLTVGGAARHSTSEAARLFKLDSGGEESFLGRDGVA